MSRGHLTEREVEGMRSGGLAGGEHLHVFEHVATCAQCSERIASGNALPRLVRELVAESEPHLDLDTQIIPYVDGTLDVSESEIVESHLDDCAMCRAEVTDLQRLREQRSSQQGSVRKFPAAFWFGIVAAAAVIVLVFLNIQDRRTTIPVPQPSRPIVIPATTITTSPATSPTMRREWQSLKEHALGSGELPFPDLTALRPPIDVPRGTGSVRQQEFHPAGIVIDEAKPTFSWPSTKGAQYVVAVYEDETEVARSESLRVAQWTPAKALRRGRTYQWQVEVTYANGTTDILPVAPAPPSLFRITDDATHAELVDAKKEHPDDAVLLAALYARAGLEREALDALDRASTNDARVRTLREHIRN